MKLLAWTIFFISIWITPCPAAECDEFVSRVAPAKDAYQKTHRIFPIPAVVKDLAVRFMPRLWVHPASWQPIAFEDYLVNSRLVSKNDKKVLLTSPAAHDLMALSYEEQCSAYLEADAVPPRNAAPMYIQVFWDENPADPAETWTYIKYNLIFDWSGLAAEISWLSRIGSFLSGGKKERWHRLDIHLAAVLAFDARKQFRLLTLAQHNHQQTYIVGIDLPANQRPLLVAAIRSNELYLDDGSTNPTAHRVVPFFSDVAYLIDPNEKPWFWAIDIAYGRNAGGKEKDLKPFFIAPKHPLADYAGLLAPPRRLLGMYIGRDGPPGYNYYALPAYISLVNFASMGFWREGDHELLQQLKPLIVDKDDMRGTDWEAMVALMRRNLAREVLRVRSKMN